MASNLKEEAKSLPAKLADFSTVKLWLRKSNDTIEAMLSKRIPADMFLRAIVSEFRQNPDLHLCPSMTVLGAIFEMAQLGLMPSKQLGVAFMVPFKEHGNPKCTLVIGYKGFTVLARRERAHLEGVIVREGDEFDLDLGRPVPLIHKPDLTINRKDPGKVLAAYAKLLHPDGYMQIEPMGMSDLEEIRKNAPSNRNPKSAWHTARIPMWEKCPVRRLGTKSAFGSIVRAAALDEAGDTYGMTQQLELTAAEVMDIEEIPTEQRSQPRAEELPPEPPQQQEEKRRRTRTSHAGRKKTTTPPPRAAPGKPVHTPEPPPADDGKPRIDDARVAELTAKCKQANMPSPVVGAWLQQHLNVKRIAELNEQQANQLENWLDSKLGA